MTANQLRRLFPNAPDSFILRNTTAPEPVAAPVQPTELARRALAQVTAERFAEPPVARLVITVPIPSVRLSPNAARVHWAEKQRRVRFARGVAKTCALAAKPADWVPLVTATVLVRWYSVKAIIADSDNRQATLKSTFDGLADAKIFENDRGLTHLPLEQFKDAKNPRVEIYIL